MHATTSLKQSILAECEDDYVGLWSIIRDVEDELTGASEAKIRDETLDVLCELLKSGQIVAGFPDSNGQDFHPWPFPAQIVFDKIKESWKPTNRPQMGEMVWFTSKK